MRIDRGAARGMLLMANNHSGGGLAGPTNFTATPQANRDVVLAWTDAPGAFNYNITQDGVFVDIVPQGVRSYTIYGGVRTFDGPAELPRYYVDTTYPTITGTTYVVHAGDDLQAIINTAAANGTNLNDQILIDQNATFSGHYNCPGKVGTGWIVIRTAGTFGTDLPAIGTRARPSTATNYAKIITPGDSLEAFTLTGATHHWRLACLEVTNATGTYNFSNQLIQIGTGSETSRAAAPQYITVDRCYVHAAEGATPPRFVKHGITMNGSNIAVIDSWVSDCTYPGSESQALSCWSGTGPFKIVNNHLEAASECVLFGGAPIAIPGAHPSDLECRNNHFYKPLSWVGKIFVDSDGNSHNYNIKNLFECKHMVRALLEGNVFENNWSESDQDGHALNFLPGADSAPVINGLADARTEDITIRYNIIKNAATGVEIAANYGQQSLRSGRHFSVHDNLMDTLTVVGGNAEPVMGVIASNDITGLRVVHNTILRADGASGAPFYFSRGGGVPAAAGVVVQDNLAGGGQPIGAVAGDGFIGINALTQWAGSDWLFDHNVFWNSNVAPPDSRAPAGNNWATDQTAVMMNSDRSLNVSSPYKSTASDGTDPGADIATLLTKTSGVVVAA